MADQQQLDLLLQGVDTWNIWRTHQVEARPNLSGANLSGARTRMTMFGNVDLRKVKGLETINHVGPSNIATNTISRSAGDVPDVFLRGAGLSDTFITYAHSLAQNHIEYY